MDKPEALLLAHWLERDGASCQRHVDAAVELRRLHDDNENTLKHFSDAVEAYKVMSAQRDALLEALKAILSIDGHSALTEAEAEQQAEQKPCSTDPRAPHGFDRTASHTAGRYVCECEHWQAEHFCDTHCTWADHAAGCVRAEPVAKVELMTTGGNAGLATRIVEIDDHLRERLRPGQLLYTAPPQQAEPVEPVAWMYTGIKQDGTEHGPHLVWKPEYMDAMSASKGAKATPLYIAPPQQPEPAQEPVAWMVYTEGGTSAYVTDNPNDLVGAYCALPLYTAPPQRKPLTEEEIPALAEQVLKPSVYCDAEALLGTDGLVALVRAVEAKHNIKE